MLLRTAALRATTALAARPAPAAALLTAGAAAAAAWVLAGPAEEGERGRAATARAMAGARLALAEPYQMGQALGEGLRGEIWRGRHPNVNVLDTEVEPIQLFMSYVRNRDVVGSTFVSYANQLFRIVLSFAAAELPTEEGTVVTTPTGAEIEVAPIEKDDTVVCLTVLHEGRQDCFEEGVDDCFPSCIRAFVTVDPITGLLSNFQGLPKLEDHTCIVVIDDSMAVDTGLDNIVDHLVTAGAEKENIVVTLMSASISAMNKFTHAHGDIKVVTASIDPDTKDGVVIPGMGDLRERYTDALKASGANRTGGSAGAAGPTAASSSGGGSWWWFWGSGNNSSK